MNQTVPSGQSDFFCRIWLANPDQIEMSDLLIPLTQGKFERAKDAEAQVALLKSLLIGKAA